jgi:site-specific DNA-methyltransferase (adenine-specific)
MTMKTGLFKQTSNNPPNPLKKSNRMELNRIISGDCLEGLKTLPDGCANLIMTSPPYAEARKKTYGGIPADEYIAWFTPIAKECYRILAKDGSFILNIGDNTIDGETHLYTFEIPIVLKREIGFCFIDPLIWHKKTTPPGKFKNRFKGAWEFCYHFSKQIDIKFNPLAVAEPASDVSVARYLRHKESHVQKSRSGSGFNNPSGSGLRRHRENESGFSTVDDKLNMLEMALPSNVLHLAPESMNVGHSAPYPTELPTFFIRAFTDEKDLVIDPFLGSGTTAVIASKLERNFIGCELLPENVELAKKRLQSELGMFNTLNVA